MRCAAPWYEMNVQAPENRVSTCCFYYGKMPDWDQLEAANASMLDVWNHPDIQHIRRIQVDSAVDPGGCKDCGYFFNQPDKQEVPYFNFEAPPDLSDKQRQNLELAKAEFESGATELKSLPLRQFFFFGFQCNINCIMCIQIPRRREVREQIADDLYQRWKEWFAYALSVDCMGGDPFAIMSCLKFMRSFVDDPDLDSVRLNLYTNGHLIDRHLDWLKKKRKVGFQISLDSVEEGYEYIRAGGKWEHLRANLMAVQDLIQGERPDWVLATNALMTRTGVPFLPSYARFHVESGILTNFYTLSQARGNEEVMVKEDITRYPFLLDDLPHWEEYFQEAIAIFTAAGRTVETEMLEKYRGIVKANIENRPTYVAPTNVVASVSGDDVGRMVVQKWRLVDNVVRRNEHGLGFDVEKADSGLFLRVNFFDTLPPSGIVTYRLKWHKAIPVPGTVYCIVMVNGVPSVKILNYREFFADDGFVKEVTAHITEAAKGGNQHLLIQLGSAGSGKFNLLPDTFELLL